MNLFEPVYKAFQDFVMEFTSRRLAGALLLLLILVAGFSILDRYSPYFIMGRLERATGLLERLSANRPPQDDQDLFSLKNSIVRQVRAQVEPGPLIGVFAPGSSVKLSMWKFGAGAGVWLLFALFFIPDIRRDPTKWNGLFGALFFGAVFGFLGTVLVPDDWATWKVLGLYGIGNFLLFVIAVLLWQNRKSPS